MKVTAEPRCRLTRPAVIRAFNYRQFGGEMQIAPRHKYAVVFLLQMFSLILCYSYKRSAQPLTITITHRVVVFFSLPVKSTSTQSVVRLYNLQLEADLQVSQVEGLRHQLKLAHSFFFSCFPPRSSAVTEKLTNSGRPSCDGTPVVRPAGSRQWLDAGNERPGAVNMRTGS